MREARRADGRDMSYVYFFSFATRKILRTCYTEGRATVLEVCIDGRQRAELETMKKALKEFANVIVIGGEESFCYLVSLGDMSEATPHKGAPLAFERKVQLLRAFLFFACKYFCFIAANCRTRCK